MVFSDLDLSRRLERAEAIGGARFVEAYARAQPQSSNQWIEVAGAYAMFNGPESPVTQTFGLGLFAEPTAADLDTLEAFFLERGAPVVHEVSPLAGVTLAGILAERGYRPVELTSVMYQPIELTSDLSAPSDSRISTRLLAEGEEGLWSLVLTRGWDAEPGLEQFMLDVGRATASCDGIFAFFAFRENDDKTPIATAALRCDGGVALFAGASTIPEARRQGAQAALLRARLSTAAGRGCDVAMICAEPGSTSQRNAERKGFRIAYTRTKWQLLKEAASERSSARPRPARQAREE